MRAVTLIIIWMSSLSLLAFVGAAATGLVPIGAPQLSRDGAAAPVPTPVPVSAPTPPVVAPRAAPAEAAPAGQRLAASATSISVDINIDRTKVGGAN